MLTIESLDMLFWGYSLIWFGLVLYVLSLGKRQRQLEAEVQNLHQHASRFDRQDGGQGDEKVF